MSTKKDAAAAKKALTHKATERVLTNSDFLSMGLTLGNLSAYGRSYGGFVKGLIYRLIGKSQSAKTFFAKMILAEAAINPNFNNYELIYDDIEKGGELLPTQKFFGSILANRITAPAHDKNKNPLPSASIDEFYTRINKRLAANKKFIWIADSLDGLRGAAESKMGDGKAKVNSQELRRLIRGLSDTGSILILIQHAKVEIGKMSWIPQDITTGGASPEFYSTLDIWLQKIKTLKKKVNDTSYPIGVLIKAHIKKNRINGTDRSFTFPLLYDYGIDDITSCIDWLVYCGHWEGNETRTKIVAPEFGKFTGSASKLAKLIEKNDERKELQTLVSNVWREIEKNLASNRKPRYS